MLSSLAPTSTAARLFAGLFAAGLIYSLAMIARGDEHFLSRPFIEDSFYSLSVARSLGQGGGISIDGVTPTNGVQPLICFLDAPAFAIGDGHSFASLRLVLALQVALAGLAALALAWFATTLLREPADETMRRDLFWLTAGTVSVSYSLLTHLHNGLETSLAAGFVFASMAFYIERIARRPEAPASEFVRLGALLGLGVLARIDIAILSASIAAWHLVASSARVPRRTAPLAGAAIIGLVSFLVSLPWWLYNVIGFGHLMPTSGLAQQDLLTDRLESLGVFVRGISNALMLVVHAPGEIGGVIAYAGLIGLAATVILFATVRPLRTWATTAGAAIARSIEARDTVPLVLFVVILAVYYTFFFGAPHFIPRYLAALWMTITVAVLVTLLALWRVAPPRSPGRRAIATIAVVAVVVSFGAQSRQFTREGLYTNVLLFPADWIAAHTSESDRIGMFQSGTTGFMFRRVTNLDGKVNPRALEALRTGGLPRLVDSARFDYIIDLDFYTRHIFRDPAVRARYEPVDTLPMHFVVWRRVR